MAFQSGGMVPTLRPAHHLSNAVDPVLKHSSRTACTTTCAPLMLVTAMPSFPSLLHRKGDYDGNSTFATAI
jgi:hypothetical protein